MLATPLRARVFHRWERPYVHNTRTVRTSQGLVVRAARPASTGSSTGSPLADLHRGPGPLGRGIRPRHPAAALAGRSGRPAWRRAIRRTATAGWFFHASGGSYGGRCLQEGLVWLHRSAGSCPSWRARRLDVASLALPPFPSARSARLPAILGKLHRSVLSGHAR